MFSQTILLGRLGKDPESKSTGGGGTKTLLSVATDEKYKDESGQWASKTEWHRVVCFGKQAEYIAKNAKKGALVHIIGKNHTYSYDKDGEKRYVTEVEARTIDLIDKPPRQEKPKQEQANGGGPDDGWF